MLEALIQLTSTEPYKSNGGMRVKEILIKPWETPDATITLEIWKNEMEDLALSECWEIICLDLSWKKSIPLAIIPGMQLKLYDDHPLLWSEEIYFSITGKATNIAALMGDLFIEHTRACGNWVDFHRLYGGLPKTLETLRENQLAIPTRLKEVCFQVLEKYGVQYSVNSTESDDTNNRLLFFSNDNTWPDNENFKQPYIIAREFTARKLA